YYGDADAVIAESVMNPRQLRMSDVAMRATEEKEDGAEEAECAYINENNNIVVDRLQLITHLRPTLTKLERGIVSLWE
ncbi:septum site-determining protein MinC, partial [Bacillus thuringiensis]